MEEEDWPVAEEEACEFCGEPVEIRQRGTVRVVCEPGLMALHYCPMPGIPKRWGMWVPAPRELQENNVEGGDAQDD